MRRLVPSLLLVAWFLSSGGCTAVRLLSSESGVDRTIVAQGASRETVERVVGSPVRCWRNPVGPAFCVYEFDAGRVSAPGEAVLFGFFDVLTLFMFELLSKETLAPHERTTRLLVSYDDRGVALGVFDEFAVLPDDGRRP